MSNFGQRQQHIAFQDQPLGEFPLLKRAASPQIQFPSLCGIQPMMDQWGEFRKERSGHIPSSWFGTVLKGLASEPPGCWSMTATGPESPLHSFLCPILLLSLPFHRYWSYGYYLINIPWAKKKKNYSIFWALVTYLAGTMQCPSYISFYFSWQYLIWPTCDLNVDLLGSPVITVPHFPL